MKVLVYAHRLEIGGTQTNAIELAAAVRDRAGHQVTMLAAPGPAAALAEARGVPLVEAPTCDRHPSGAAVRALRAAVHRVRPDVLHTWDWPQCLDALVGVHLSGSVPILCTAMGMEIPRFLPRRIPTTLGTPALVAHALRQGRRAELLEPPVDIEANRPGAVDSASFADDHDLEGDGPLVVSVSRLTRWLKLDSLRRAVEAVPELDHAGFGVRLAIVGDGPERGDLTDRAEEVNRLLGRRAVAVTGPMVDPRPAYQAADVVIGMGGSALRAMAFAKPVVVVGEGGFSEPFDRETAPRFLHGGYYGTRPGRAPLATQLEALLADEGSRAQLGAFGRQVVVERYGLAPAADRVARSYRRATTEPVGRVRALTDVARTAGLRLGDVATPDRLRHGVAALVRAS